MAFQRVLLAAVTTLLAAQATAQAPMMLATPGAPPDIMGTFIGPMYVGSVNTQGVFSFQGTASATQAASGSYLSHTCNPDGTFDAVWSVDTYSPTTGALASQTAYCEHGAVMGSTYVSLYMPSMTCPLTAPFTGATNRTLPESAGSNVGSLSTHPYCNPNIDPSLQHTTANTPAAAPTPIISHPGPGTTQVTQGSVGAPTAGGAVSNP